MPVESGLVDMAGSSEVTADDKAYTTPAAQMQQPPAQFVGYFWFNFSKYL